MSDIQQQAPPSTKAPGIISTVFGSLVALILFVIISAATSILIEWVGMNYLWPDEKHTHAQQVLETEMSYANEAISSHFFKDGLAAFYKYGSHSTTSLFEYFDLSNQNVSSAHNSDLEISVMPYAEAAFYVSQTVILRTIVVISSVFIYIFVLSQAVVDGFIARELRRLGGGRERDKRYKIARRYLVGTFFLGNVLYIAWPQAIHPMVCILPTVFFMYIFLRNAIYRFQKYW